MKEKTIGNFRNAVDHAHLSGGLQLFARGQKPSEFRRIDVGSWKLTLLASGPLLYGIRPKWRDAFVVRRDRASAENPDPSVSAPAAPCREEATPREVANVSTLRIFRPDAYRREKDPAIIDEILRTVVTVLRGPAYSSTHARYSKTTSYGWKYARRTSAQLLGRNARNTAFRTHGVDVDVGDFHKALLLKKPKEAYNSDGDARTQIPKGYPILKNYLTNYMGRVILLRK